MLRPPSSQHATCREPKANGEKIRNTTHPLLEVNITRRPHDILLPTPHIRHHIRRRQPLRYARHIIRANRIRARRRRARRPARDGRGGDLAIEPTVRRLLDVEGRAGRIVLVAVGEVDRPPQKVRGVRDGLRGVVEGGAERADGAVVVRLLRLRGGRAGEDERGAGGLDVQDGAADAGGGDGGGSAFAARPEEGDDGRGGVGCCAGGGDGACEEESGDDPGGHGQLSRRLGPRLSSGAGFWRLEWKSVGNLL